ncbi:MAG: hypothetical protein H6R18_907 [Proteobacteria bacterium]|nr:hypothetical protein [Pseudomonadota bacterium]
MTQSNTQLVRIAIAVLLIIGCVYVLKPFVGPLLLAAVICITVWPLHARLLTLFRQRQTLSAFVTSLLLVLLIVLPMIVLSGSLAGAVEAGMEQVKPLLQRGISPDAPAWLGKLPLVGGDIAAYWHKVVASREELNKLLQMGFDPARRLLLASVTIFGQGLFQLLLVVFFVFFIFRDAKIYGEALDTAAHKLAGDLGKRMVRLAQNTVTGVMVGIVGTAAAQAVVAMIGYLIVGVPGLVVLTFATFILSMVPVIGATMIWGGVAVWLYQDGQTGWAIFMVLWGLLAVSSVDNFVKPILISRTASLPLLLIIVGVFGGVMVFGFIGLFLGPVLLALGQALLCDWINEKKPVEQVV